jgi:hypothetical protein
MDWRLRTFCHISEYDEAGYRRLHRMILASDPLVLWAPSSQLLSDSGVCRIPPDDFLWLVEEGIVQIIAREQWLDSPSFRDSHPWPGARWNRRIDGALRRMFRDDEREPDLRRRRVAGAPDETGPDRARRALEEQPEVASKVLAVLNDRQRRPEIPPGTLATAARTATGDRGKTEVILRDAFNHAEAIALAEAETAILLSPGGGVFSQLVASAFTQEMEGAARKSGGLPVEGSVAAAVANLAGELVDLLGTLDTVGPVADLRSFVQSPARRELVDWSRAALDALVHRPSEELKEDLALRLKADLEAGRFFSELPGQRFREAAALVLAILATLEDPGPLALLGLAFAVYPLLEEGARAQGLADADFSGPQWPFRYVWGTGPRQGQHARLLELLEPQNGHP